MTARVRIHGNARKRPRQALAFVRADGDATDVRVRWRDNVSASAWRCDVHGPQPAAECEHAVAVAEELVRIGVIRPRYHPDVASAMNEEASHG